MGDMSGKVGGCSVQWSSSLHLNNDTAPHSSHFIKERSSIIIDIDIYIILVISHAVLCNSEGEPDEKQFGVSGDHFNISYKIITTLNDFKILSRCHSEQYQH